MNRSESIVYYEHMKETLLRGISTVSSLLLGFGTLVMFIGLYLCAKLETLTSLIGVEFHAEFAHIGLGIVLVLTACLGFAYISDEKVILLFGYLMSVMVLILLFFPIGMSAVSRASDDRIDNEVGSAEWKSLENYFEDPLAKFFMDELQNGYDCCGVLTYSDWGHNEHFSCEDDNKDLQSCAVPKSCCKDYVGTLKRVEESLHWTGSDWLVLDWTYITEVNYESVDQKCVTNILNGTMTSKIDAATRIYTKGCKDVLSTILKKSCYSLAVMCFISATLGLMGFVVTILLLGEIYANPPKFSYY